MDELTRNWKKLLSAEKNPMDQVVFDKIFHELVHLQKTSPGKKQTLVIDHQHDVIYYLHLLITPIFSKFSIGLRFKESGYALVRFDFGDHLRHINYDENQKIYLVIGSHVDFYSHPDKYLKKNVIPINQLESFQNIKKIHEVYLAFLTYTKIVYQEKKNDCLFSKND